MTAPRRLEPQLLSLVVHEFRTPITIVAGYLRMMLRDSSVPVPDGQRRMIEEAERSCSRLAGLVADLSDLSNLMTGTATFNRHEVAVFALLGEAVAQLAPTGEPALIARGTDAEAVAIGDAVRLRQAFAATIAVVRRELLPDTPLIIERQIYHTRQKQAVIAIGIDPTVQRLTASRVRKLGPFNVWRGGAGLSMVIAEQVIHAHGGKLGALPGIPRSQPGAVIILPLQS